MSATYFGILTKVGEAKQANAMALGGTLKLTQLAVGDGAGNVPTPDREQIRLIGEWRRAPLNQLYVHADNPNYLVAEQVIPENEGGRWMREWGLYDDDGDLVAVSNCPPTYKPLLSEGSGRTQVVRMVIMVASTAAFMLKIDPSVVLATRQYVDDGLDKKLDKTATAVASHKLETARNVSITGGATATATRFDGTQDLELEVTSLNMDKAKDGVLAVARGGTGLSTVATGSFLSGEGTQALVPRTAAQVYSDIGVPKGISDSLAAVGLGTVSAGTGIADLNDPALIAGMYYTNGTEAQGNWNKSGFLLHRVYGNSGFQLGNQSGTNVLKFRSRSGGVWGDPVELATVAYVAGNYPRVYSISALPTQNLGPITVAEYGEVWIWFASTSFTGYRSPGCGLVDWFTGQTAPVGYLRANGAAVSVATYSALAAAIYCGNSLNATAQFGYRCTDPAKPSTSRSTTGAYIVLPDLRGEFIRGFDDGRGVDVGRALGSSQGDNVRGPAGGGNLVTTASAISNLALGTGATGSLIGGIAAFGTSATDTRPRNIAMLACIKF